ncbi:hypothetical protein ACFPRL_19105 [Pseudoclavibacter helvolus]
MPGHLLREPARDVAGTEDPPAERGCIRRVEQLDALREAGDRGGKPGDERGGCGGGHRLSLALGRERVEGFQSR